MPQQLDIFRDMPRRSRIADSYPARAGHKGGGASLEAAQRITQSGKRQSLEERVMGLFFWQDAWSPDQAADVLGCHIADIRPRMSELCKPKYDSKGVLVRKAFLQKTDNKLLSARGNNQHIYIRI